MEAKTEEIETKTEETEKEKLEKKLKPGEFIIDVLISGPAGELVFKPIIVSKGKINDLIKATLDPIAKAQLKKELKKIEE